MKAKKIVAMVLSAAMTLSLAACGSKEVSDTPESTVAGSEEETEAGRYGRCRHSRGYVREVQCKTEHHFRRRAFSQPVWSPETWTTWLTYWRR